MFPFLIESHLVNYLILTLKTSYFVYLKKNCFHTFCLADYMIKFLILIKNQIFFEKKDSDYNINQISKIIDNKLKILLVQRTNME